MTGAILRRWLLGTALNMAGHEGNHVVERIYFHIVNIVGITIVIIYHEMWLEMLGCRDGQKLVAGQCHGILPTLGICIFLRISTRSSNGAGALSTPLP